MNTVGTVGTGTDGVYGIGLKVLPIYKTHVNHTEHGAEGKQAAMCVRTITLVLAWCVSASGRRCLGPPEVARPLDRNFSTCGGAPPSVWRDAAPYPETSCAFCAGNAATAHLLEIAAELRRLKARECRRLVVYGAAFGTSFSGGGQIGRSPARGPCRTCTVRTVGAFSSSF